MNSLLENINTSLARAAELTSDPAMLRVLKTIKKQAAALAMANEASSRATSMLDDAQPPGSTDDLRRARVK